MQFVDAVSTVERAFDFIVIDTPKSDTYLMRLAHAMADTLVTAPPATSLQPSGNWTRELGHHTQIASQDPGLPADTGRELLCCRGVDVKRTAISVKRKAISSSCMLRNIHAAIVNSRSCLSSLPHDRFDGTQRLTWYNLSMERMPMIRDRDRIRRLHGQLSDPGS